MSRILIVDDEINILMSLEYLLKRKGYEVFIARNGTEALQLADEKQPDLVLLDIMMPDVDGYEVCTELKSSARTKIPKVIFLSAKSKKTDVEKGYEVGADLYLMKPFSTRELTKQIQELLTN
jgi:DNA-binding response OmpR family regulator